MPGLRLRPTHGTAARAPSTGGLAALARHGSVRMGRISAWMFCASWPLGPSVTSKLTREPCLRVLNPSMAIAEKCANTSAPPPSGSMNPKPLASLNHLTVPVAMFRAPSCYSL